MQKEQKIHSEYNNLVAMIQIIKKCWLSLWPVPVSAFKKFTYSACTYWYKKPLFFSNVAAFVFFLHISFSTSICKRAARCFYTVISWQITIIFASDYRHFKMCPLIHLQYIKSKPNLRKRLKYFWELLKIKPMHLESLTLIKKA